MKTEECKAITIEGRKVAYLEPMSNYYKVVRCVGCSLAEYLMVLSWLKDEGYVVA